MVPPKPLFVPCLACKFIDVNIMQIDPECMESLERVCGRLFFGEPDKAAAAMTQFLEYKVRDIFNGSPEILLMHFVRCCRR